MNYFIPALISLLLAQFTKCILDSISKKKITFQMINSSGGMPSSHSSTVTALTTYIGLVEGISSPVFAVALISALITMYDAIGVRQETGRQGAVLNEMIDLINELGKEIDVEKRFNTLIGHTKFQVFCGALFGVIVALIYYWIEIRI